MRTSWKLSDVIDDLTDAIEDVVIRLYMYNIPQIDPPALPFCALIIECIRTLQQALEEFRHFKKSTALEGLIRRVNELEEDGDRLYARNDARIVRHAAGSAGDPWCGWKFMSGWRNAATAARM